MTTNDVDPDGVRAELVAEATAPGRSPRIAKAAAHWFRRFEKFNTWCQANVHTEEQRRVALDEALMKEAAALDALCRFRDASGDQRAIADEAVVSAFDRASIYYMARMRMGTTMRPKKIPDDVA